MSARYTVVLDREVDGRVIAGVPGVPGCHVYGRTPAVAVRRVRAALNFWLEAPPRKAKHPSIRIQP